MKNTKEKKPALTKAQKTDKRKARLQLFKDEIHWGATAFYENRWSIFAWVACYLFLALTSLFFTRWTIADPSDFPGIISNLLPRTVSLLLLTLWAFGTRCRKTVFSGGATVWCVWMLLLSDVSYGLVVVAAIAGAILTGIFFRFEIVKGYGRKSNGTMLGVTKWFYSLSILTMLVEVVHRIDIDVPFLNIYAPFVNLIKNPDIFALNLLVISFTGLFIFICAKKKLAFSIFSTVWLVLAVVSYIKYNNVYEPAVFLDIFQIADGLAYVQRTFSIWLLILIILAVACLCFLAYYAAKREKSVHVHGCAVVFVIALAIPLALSFFGVRQLSYTDSEGKYVRGNYFKYGFPFSFFNYAFDSSVSEPDNYSQSVIDEIKANVEKNYKEPADKKEVQNVIVIQLESFCDPMLLASEYPDFALEKDPMPFLNSLKNEYSSGTVSVPVFGGQTVKSEFEFLSGISLESDSLPSGYNPYVTYLNDNSIDNIVRYFKGEGYTATAIHNYQGEFFSRYEVYENLGFDTYIPYECMSGIEKRYDHIWAPDQRLADEVLKVISSTDSKDFVYGITVQLHASYDPIPRSEYTVGISGIDDEKFEGSLAYYIKELEQLDKAIENLVKELQEREEPTYLLMYGDHLPKLFYDVDSMTDVEKYTTQYFTWNNIGIEKSDANMKLSQLTSERLCKDLSFSGTFINKFNSVYQKESPEVYEKAKDVVDYHILTVEANKPEYKNESYKIGLYPLSLSAVKPDENTGRYIIHGNEITENTVMVINGHVYDLTFEDANTAYLDLGNKKLENSDVVYLRIVGERNGAVFCESVRYKYNAKDSTITQTDSQFPLDEEKSS